MFDYWDQSQRSSSNRYATFFYAQYDPATRILAYVNGGHNPPLIFRKSGKLLKLETGGPVVGLLAAPLFRYDQAFVTLEPGDVLVAFTDGISEAMNSADEEWGEERLIECVRRLVDLPAKEVISGLMAAADEFAGGAVQHDDMTLIVAKVS